MRSGRKKTPVMHIVHRVVFGFMLVLNVYPLVWMVINSFKSERELTYNPLGFPREILWSNYVDAWKMGKFNLYFFNSLFTALTAVVVTLMLASLASFFISRFEFKMKKALLFYFSIGLMIPIHATLVSLFIEMRTLDLLNTRWTLLFPYTAFELPIALFILAGFMRTFPKELEEAAIMDGCGVMGIFAKITMPMMVPALSTAFILTFLNNWNEFSFALVLINDDALKTLPLGLANFTGSHNRTYTVEMAGLTIVLIPTLLFFMSLQKYLTQGMTAGAVKG